MAENIQPDSRGIEPQRAVAPAPESVVFQAPLKPYITHHEELCRPSDICFPEGTADKPFVPDGNTLAYVLGTSSIDDRFVDQNLT